jgi:hypothetical protein
MRFYTLPATVPVICPGFIAINCTEVMKALNYYDNLLNIYIPVGQRGRSKISRLPRIFFLKYEVIETK